MTQNTRSIAHNVFICHFLTGKFITRLPRLADRLGVTHQMVNVVSSHFHSSTLGTTMLKENKPYQMFVGGKQLSQSDDHILSVDTSSIYSRKQLLSKFESSMSKKNKLEYYKPLTDEDSFEVKYVEKSFI